MIAIELTSIALEIHAGAQRLSKGADALFMFAKAHAEAEKIYRAALGKEIMRLKSEGLQATLIPDVARGNTSELKFARDIADFKYSSARDSLKAIACQVNALQTIIRYQSEV